MFDFKKLLGRSPLKDLILHIDQVSLCMKKLEETFNCFLEQKTDQLAGLAEEVSHHEHQADHVKNDMRKKAVRRGFGAMSQMQVLEVLRQQDRIADQCEMIATVLATEQLKPIPELSELASKLFAINHEAFLITQKIVLELETLLEATFGGAEAMVVKDLTYQASVVEHRSDLCRREFLVEFFKRADELPNSTFYLWVQLIDHIAALSHICEKHAYYVRMFIEVKG
ncbi:MAG: hypothetical protein S4CHLAM102_05620 [Chlamydiia bacterium]|nr:hypothetical protein [Chlamydiia bacterium]